MCKKNYSDCTINVHREIEADKFMLKTAKFTPHSVIHLEMFLVTHIVRCLAYPDLIYNILMMVFVIKSFSKVNKKYITHTEVFTLTVVPHNNIAMFSHYI